MGSKFQSMQGLSPWDIAYPREHWLRRPQSLIPLVSGPHKDLSHSSRPCHCFPFSSGLGLPLLLQFPAGCIGFHLVSGPFCLCQHGVTKINREAFSVNKIEISLHGYQWNVLPTVTRNKTGPSSSGIKDSGKKEKKITKTQRGLFS